MRAIFLNKTLAAASANNICLSQTPGGAGALTLNGAAVVNGVAVLDSQRQVQITAAANETGHNFVVTGTDERGIVISETVAGPNATTAATVQNYKTVTSITISAAATGALTVGTNGVGSSPCQVLDQYVAPFAISLFLKFAGVSNATVQYTSDDVFSSTFVDGNASWTDHASLTSKTTNTDSNLAYPASAVRMKINSGTAQTTLIIREAGIGGI